MRFRPRSQLRGGIILLIAAMQCMLDQLIAILEQIGTKLPARARQIMQRIEVELAGKLSNYTED